MAFELSFSGEFYGDVYNPEIQDRPTSVANAIASMKVKDPERWSAMAKEVFGYDDPENLPGDVVYEKILETNSCASYHTPVEVYIDGSGWYSVKVHD